jgi:hypothetical protein
MNIIIKSMIKAYGGEIGLHSIVFNPESIKINNGDIKIGDVIREVTSCSGEVTSVYGDLLKFCVMSDGGLGLVENENFFVYPYDWRLDNLVVAREFGQVVESKLKDMNDDCHIVFISHSMGGIVTRLMLNENVPLSNKTRLHFQIASPISGSILSYSAMLGHPIFNDKWADSLLASLNGSRKIKIKEFFQELYSVYQLLPPENEEVLRYKNKTYSCFTLEIWDNKQKEIDKAKEVHKVLLNKQSVPTKSIYSKMHLTDSYYSLKESYDIDYRGKVGGDNTVIAASACNNHYNNDYLEISTHPADHMGMCSNINLFEMLRRAYNEL